MMMNREAREELYDPRRKYHVVHGYVSVLRVNMSGNFVRGLGKIKSSKLKSGKVMYAIYSPKGAIISNAYPTLKQAIEKLKEMHHQYVSYMRAKKGSIIGYGDE